jgi:hypothetical protein
MADDEYLAKRGFTTTPNPSYAGNIEDITFNKTGLMMPIPFDMSQTPLRKLKSQYKTQLEGGGLSITEQGFNFTVEFFNDKQEFPNLFMYVKIGSPLQFSYTVGGEMFTFPILNQVNSVLWKKKSVVFDVSFVNHSTMTITIKENALQGDHYVGSITTDTTLDSLFKEEKGNRIPLYSIIHLSEDDKEKRKVLRLNFNNLESFKQMKEGNASAKDMMKNILRYGGMVKYYIDDNSFLEMETKYVDDYLRQESIQWKGVKDFADDEYIEIVLEIDGSTNATDNYTGINKENPEKRMVKLIFPQEFDSLAPLATMEEGMVFCGEEGSRITQQKYSKETALFTFRDGKECLIPNPETKEFIAKDTSTGQVLTGKVLSLELKKGNGMEEVRKRKALRKKNNINESYSFEGKLDSIAWLTGQNNDFIKVIVPQGDKLKIVTINVGDL